MAAEENARARIAPGRVRLFKLIILGMTALMLLVVVEVGVRLRQSQSVNTLLDVDHWPAPDGEDTNEDGLRTAIDPDALEDEDNVTLFLGDSFVYGYRLPREQALPARVEARARAAHPERNDHVINFGWTSSSPLLTLRRLKKIGERYRPDHIVLMLDMTDYADDIKYDVYLRRPGLFSMLHVTPGLFLAVRRLLGRPPLWAWEVGAPENPYFVANQPLAESEPWLAPLVANVEAIAAEAERLGATFHLVHSVRHWQVTDKECPDDWEREHYTPLGPHVQAPLRFFEDTFGPRFHTLTLYDAFRTTSVFPTTFPEDPHWTPEGTEVAAEAIYAFLVEGGVFGVNPHSTDL